MLACLKHTLLLSIALFLPTGAVAQNIPAPPPTPKRPVTDVYHGVKVVDNYRWLEDWNNPEVKKWNAAENARTRAYLDHLQDRSEIRAQLAKLLSESSSRYFDLQYVGGTLFAMKMQPPKQQAMLVALQSPDDTAGEKVVVDPNAMNEAGSIAIDFYVPSLDGKLVAVSLSKGGSEDGTGRIFESATGKELPDRVARVNFATAGGSIAWKADSSGFYYTRYPQGNERPPEDANFYQQIYFHKLGTPSSEDTYVLGKDFPRIAEIHLQSSDDGKWIIAAVANGDGGQFAHYLMDPSGKWTQVTHFADEIVGAELGTPNDPSLYLLSRHNAPRGTILRAPLSDPQVSKAEQVLSPLRTDDENGRASITTFTPTDSRLYVEEEVGGPSRVEIYDLHGNPLGVLPAESISAVSDVVRTTGDNVLFRVATYLSPPAWYSLDASGDPANDITRKTALAEISSINFDDAQVVREFATSKDSTPVPLNIIRLKDTKPDGTNPTLLTGYGGYDISLTPHFVGALVRIWLNQGGVFVIANLRGGGEYGEEWHEAGMLTHKQNVFDDFIASAEYLIQHKYTSPQHLAIEGGSNGGLLMGAALTQRPDLFRAVVSFVGIYDMLRVELDPNGAFNVTEFGTVKNPEQFKALYAYSPYQHVKDGTKYPAVLFLTGENDHRVNPMQSRKMTARLQAANASDHPILLRTTASAGHGFGTALNEQIEQMADVLSFLFDQLGIHYTAGAQ
ncbi:MAG TPA: prolyl oligopeptidase family serine peptidase [Terriglobales bacterium]|nr:prolyl oligopeptidase family serine peptidase [Terriglobales bacterium]